MSRPKIPENIRRQVRRDCYFGCVICGCPVFDYDHMVNYSEVGEHTADNLVLLCRAHHLDKTANRLSLDRVRHAKLNPANKKRENSPPYKLEGNKEIEVLIGSNRSSAIMSDTQNIHYAVWVNGVGFLVIHFDDGWLSFSMVAADDKGNVILTVEEGELSFNTDVWDYRYEGTRLKIWAGRGDILFEADLSNHKVHVVRGNFITPDGDGFVVKGDMMTVMSNGEACGWEIFNECINCFYGSWAFARMDKLPNGMPRGFGTVKVR